MTGVAGMAQLADGIAGLTLGGWLGDRFGAKKATIAMLLGLLALSATMRLTLALWGDPAHFTVFVYAWYSLDTLITVVALPISMRLCDPRVAATQFALYMAITNFGISLGAWVFGLSDSLGGLPTMFAVVFALHLVGLVIMLTAKFPRSAKVEAQVARALASAEGPLPARD